MAPSEKIGNNSLTEVFQIKEIQSDGLSRLKEKILLHEHHMEIWAEDILINRLVCTDQFLRELITGLLYSEGYIDKIEDILDISFDEGRKKASVLFSEQILEGFKKKAEEDIKDSEKPEEDISPLKDPVPMEDLDSDWLFRLADIFSKDTELHKLSFLTHSCFLATKEDIVFSCEDIGRRNALDKAIGYGLLNKIPPEGCMIFTSGRVPVDIVRKTICAGIPVLLSKSSPTYEAVGLAKKYGLRLICRLFPDKLDIYA